MQRADNPDALSRYPLQGGWFTLDNVHSVAVDQGESLTAVDASQRTVASRLARVGRMLRATMRVSDHAVVGLLPVRERLL